MSFSVVVAASLALVGQAPPAASASASASAPPPAAGHTELRIPRPGDLPAPASLSVDRAWIRLPPPGAKMLAGYVRLRNSGGTAAKVTGVSTSLSPLAELHTHVLEGGLMKMRQVSLIEVPAGGEVQMQPGALHVMVMKLASPPKEGEVVDVTFTLEAGATVTLKATVLKEAPPEPPEPYPTVG